MANPLRKTLEFLGLAEETYDDHDTRNRSEDYAQTKHSQRATVTPLRRSSRSGGAHDVNEILTVHPKKYGDAQLIAETFREGVPVIINLTQMSESEARRLVDFASGLSQGLRGHIERVTAKVFLLSPSHVMVSAEGDGVESELEASLTD